MRGVILLLASDRHFHLACLRGVTSKTNVEPGDAS
jgi:hypothetical protein